MNSNSPPPFYEESKYLPSISAEVTNSALVSSAEIIEHSANPAGSEGTESGPSATVIIREFIHVPLVPELLGRFPRRTICPYCREHITTKVRKQISGEQLAFCFTMFILGFVLFFTWILCM